MWTLIGDGFIAVGGYVASIYTWPWIRTTCLGINEEVSKLRNRIRKLEGL
jgi:hypothetical protein